MGFTEIIEAGTTVKTKLDRERVEFQIHGGQPQTRFFIGKAVASKLKWDHKTRIRIHHGDGEDYGWVMLVANEEGLRLGRYGKNAYAVQAGKKKYFAVTDPDIRVRENCEFKVIEQGLTIRIPQHVVNSFSPELRGRLTTKDTDESDVVGE